MEYQQIHLVGRGFSGRGVRYRTLSIAQIDAVESSAGASVTKDSLVMQFHAARIRDGLTLMIKAVTETPVASGKIAEAKWRQLKEGELADCWDALFTAKDFDYLKRLYEDEHTVSKADGEEIMAGKVTVVD